MNTTRKVWHATIAAGMIAAVAQTAKAEDFIFTYNGPIAQRGAIQIVNDSTGITTTNTTSSTLTGAPGDHITFQLDITGINTNAAPGTIININAADPGAGIGVAGGQIVDHNGGFTPNSTVFPDSDRGLIAGYFFTSNFQIFTGSGTLNEGGPTPFLDYAQLSLQIISPTAVKLLEWNLGVSADLNGQKQNINSTFVNDSTAYSSDGTPSVTPVTSSLDSESITTDTGSQTVTETNYGQGNQQAIIATVPEPAKPALLLAGAGAMLGLRRPRKHALG